jgi:hypothetical protein
MSCVIIGIRDYVVIDYTQHLYSKVRGRVESLTGSEVSWSAALLLKVLWIR